MDQPDEHERDVSIQAVRQVAVLCRSVSDGLAA
jgi:hypothetical protein